MVILEKKKAWELHVADVNMWRLPTPQYHLSHCPQLHIVYSSSHKVTTMLQICAENGISNVSINQYRG